LAKLDELIKARNQFVHYRPTDYAAKAIYERSLEEMKLPGMFMIWDAGEQPTRIEPSAIQRELTPRRAVDHYCAARAVLSEWYKTVGVGAEKVDELAPAIVVREA
jgi:hypothetical protein